MKSVYIDTSAALKQVRREAESYAYVRYLETLQRSRVALTSSLLLDVELGRVAVRDSLSADLIDTILAQFLRRHISSDIVRRAALIPFHVRSLDAIHLATAMSLGDDLIAIVTYDQQMIQAATALGLPTARPGIDSSEGPA